MKPITEIELLKAEIKRLDQILKDKDEKLKRMFAEVENGSKRSN